MAAEGGRAGAPLSNVLFEEPYRFDFFQAVRLLEKIYPARAPVGGDVAPAREVVRFRTRPSLQFPASQIHEFMSRGDADGGPPPEMMVAFMGVVGALGVLPAHYTELVAERARYKDTALWEFLDLFTHRLISLFYRAWEKHHFAIAYERGGLDRFTEYLFDIVGMGTRGLRGRLNLPDEGLLLYGGLISQRPHSASAVAAILGDYFDAPARLEQFAGQWLALDAESVTRLGAANSELGVSTIAGSRIWDAQSKYRVRFGPLPLERFMSLIPSGANFRPASELAHFLTGEELDFDIQLVLRAEEVPACKLSAREDDKSPRLGWSSWLKTQPFERDDSQVVLSAMI
jgi:type VI secretion system protein ImpH